jgi:hypothetical protein
MNPVANRTDRQSDCDFSSGRRFPLIEFNYQTFSLDRFKGGSGGSSPGSFFDISRDYFQREAGRNFLAEVAFFLVLAAVLAGAFVEGARVIIHVLQLLPA